MGTEMLIRVTGPPVRIGVLGRISSSLLSKPSCFLPEILVVFLELQSLRDLTGDSSERVHTVREKNLNFSRRRI